MPKLTRSQEMKRAFVEEYLIDLHANRAAKRAGYSWGYGKKLLHMPDVIELLTEAKKDRAERLADVVSVDRVVEELARIGFANMRDYFTWDQAGNVTVKDSDELSADETAILSEIVVKETANSKTVKFRMHDKLSALDKLMRHLGAYEDKVDVSHTYQLAGEDEEVAKGFIQAHLNHNAGSKTIN